MPTAFKKRSGKELGLGYHANRKAWMTQVLFYKWLVRCNAYIGRTPNRHVALLVDNCSAHGNFETIPALKNMKVTFLLPSTTSKVQPMGARIIASVRVQCRSSQMKSVVDLIDENIRDGYKIDVLRAMRLLTCMWSTLSKDVIEHCWKHT